ncbi:MAG: LCP family protein [Propionibacteriaceae bacterium]
MWPENPDQTGSSRPPSAAPRRAHAKPPVRWGRIVIVTVAVLFAVVASAVAYYGIRLNNSISSIQREDSALPTGSRPPSATTTVQANNAPMNILLIGTDTRKTERGLSDTLIMVHLSADRKSVYLVSFPRDMYVTVPGYGKQKINAAYSYGGSSLAVQTLENLTGARIDHVVMVDFNNFIKLVDTVGAVTIDNPVASKATDDRGVKYTFPKGNMTLTDGRMALAFVRQREELPNGDLDRTLRQRAFIKALALKIATPEVMANPAKLTDVIGLISQFVKVDAQLSNQAIYSLGLSMTGITHGDQIHLLMAPISGFGMTADGLSIDIVDVAGVAALGKALQNDTMPAYVAAHPSVEYEYTPTPNPSTTPSVSKSTAKATAGATTKR